MRRLFLLLCCLLPVGASGSEWAFIRSPGMGTVELDLGSAVRDGDQVRAWDRMRYSLDQTRSSGDVAYRTVKTLVAYDCVRRTAVPLTRTFFRVDDSEIQRMNLEGAELPQSVVPDTPRGEMLALACAVKPPPPTVVAVAPAPVVAKPKAAPKPKPKPAETVADGAARTEEPAEASKEPVAKADPKPAATKKAALAKAVEPAPAPAKLQPVTWSYDGKTNGVAQWARLSPEFKACAEGKRQSPIDIKDTARLQLDGLKFDYKPSPLKIIDDGHTVQVNYAPGSQLTLGGEVFELKQFHFHKPAEERINGRTFEFAIHAEHRSKDDRVATLTVLFTIGAENPFLQTLWNNLPLEPDRLMEPPDVKVDLNQLLPKLRNYYTYMGSMTRPPCSEGVQWIVMKTPVPISRSQLGIFAKLYDMNARPIQATNGRLIKEAM